MTDNNPLIGKRVILTHMSDPYPLPSGSTGIITGIDALGDLLVDWSCGSSLKLIPEIDTFTISSVGTCSDIHTEQEANLK